MPEPSRASFFLSYMPHPASAPVPTLLVSALHPSVVRARRSMTEMSRRAFGVTGQEVKARLEVIDSSLPWAGIVEDEGRKRSSMFLTRGLVEKLTHEELVAVMGHEWGHVVRKQFWAMWALRGAALVGSLGLHLSLATVLIGPSVVAGLACLGLTVLFMACCLVWEGKASRAQELACDRFAALLVGSRGMVGALRRVDGIMRRYHGLPPRPVPFRFSWRRQWHRVRMWNTQSHPSVETRVMHIVRQRHALKRTKAC